MINFINANKFCCDDISLIENYKLAINDDTQTWHCHHRKETDLRLTRDELVEQGKYFNVPANELIFLTHTEHTKIHMKLNNQGKNHPMYGKNPEDYMSEEAVKEKRQNQSIAGKKRWEDPKERQKQSEKNKGEKNPAYGRTWMNNGINSVFLKTQEEIEHYIELGYDFGRIYKRK